MNIRYRVELAEDERRQLETLVTGGSRAVRRVKRAQILLAAASGCSDEGIARTARVGTSTVYRTKRQFVRYTEDVPTRTVRAIPSSEHPAAAASRICARLTLRTARLPPVTNVSSCRRSSSANSTR